MTKNSNGARNLLWVLGVLIIGLLYGASVVGLMSFVPFFDRYGWLAGIVCAVPVGALIGLFSSWRRFR
jgi:hypothetical protein